MCWETQLRLTLLNVGFVSLLSSTVSRGDDYRRLILAAYLQKRWLKRTFSISLGGDELESDFDDIILQLVVRKQCC